MRPATTFRFARTPPVQLGCRIPCQRSGNVAPDAEAVDFEYTALAEAPRNGVADGDDANHRAAVPAACAEAPSGRRITVGVVPVDKCPRRCKGNGPEFQFPVQYHPATAIVRQAAEFVTGDLLNSDMPKERTSPGRIVGH